MKMCQRNSEWEAPHTLNYITEAKSPTVLKPCLDETLKRATKSTREGEKGISFTASLISQFVLWMNTTNVVSP